MDAYISAFQEFFISKLSLWFYVPVNSLIFRRSNLTEILKWSIFELSYTNDDFYEQHSRIKDRD